MKTRNVIIGTVSYVGASFFVQFISHFVINADHYASIAFMREQPLMYFGLSTMFLQGIVLTVLYLKWANGTFNVRQGIRFAWLLGAFFVSYLALVEADKYNVQDIVEWVIVEAGAGAVQFTIFGFLLGRFVKVKNE
ncbi:MAG: hypothetical protein OEV74_03165 [Cyclobacteriaceae bacterium]|nr:hypothetical protein [Cyclobacteriaceae bacterium]MDH4295255.1 hypothetical protein [Cyclobacteriaceae bacterium]MDH5251284.1 hypothetical protein [Cyclobacteriaceae bacterium]